MPAAPPAGAQAGGGERRAEGTAAAEAPQPAEQLWLLVGSLGAARGGGSVPGRAAIAGTGGPDRRPRRSHIAGHAAVLANGLAGRSGLKVRVLAAGARESADAGIRAPAAA
ncbi:MAG: hypothetical protein RML12_05375 [Xanthomonadales bacterium]|nr:hypothetical protein [Xanthomonadales bacterium]